MAIVNDIPTQPPTGETVTKKLLTEVPTLSKTHGDETTVLLVEEDKLEEVRRMVIEKNRERSDAFANW